MPGTRQPNGASSIYQGADGDWHGRVTVGVRDDGKPDRRHVQRKTKAAVIKRVRELERNREKGSVRRPGRVWTVAEWLTHWVDNIASATVGENALSAYRAAVNVHLISGVGSHKLTSLQPEHLERLYAKMLRAGSKPATAHQAHRTIRASLNEAVRRGHLIRNPAVLAKAPPLRGEEVEPYSIDDVRLILRAAAQRRNSARWAIALALGLRQGETLGIKWDDIDLDTGTLRVRRNRLRPRWKHGCVNKCGRKYAGHCPKRVPARPTTGDTKSRAGRRIIGLPAELVQLLRQHRVEQDCERSNAAQLWHEGGWLFATPTGAPINPRTDYDEWKRLLTLAGVRDARLHDARHTAATVLLLVGVSERAVMGQMGWSHSAMTARYQHITAAVRHDIAERIGGLIWPTEVEDDGPSEDAEDPK